MPDGKTTTKMLSEQNNKRCQDTLSWQEKLELFVKKKKKITGRMQQTEAEQDREKLAHIRALNSKPGRIGYEVMQVR